MCLSSEALELPRSLTKEGPADPGLHANHIRKRGMQSRSERSWLVLMALLLLDLGCASTDANQGADEPTGMLRFVSTAPATVGHNQVYMYQVRVTDPGDADEGVAVRVDEKPEWLSFDSGSRTLSGLPGVEGFGTHRVALTASNGAQEVTQQFTLTVNRGPLMNDGSWVQRFGTARGHDGLPYASDNFIIYSDFSKMAARKQLADMLEAAFQELQERLSVTKDDFDYLPGSSQQIEIYADYDQNTTIGLAYRDGIILRALDSPYFVQFGSTIESTNRLIRHELMHVVEFLLIGTPRYSHASDVWIREGCASYVAGPFPSTIVSTPQVESWEDQHQGTSHGGNPIRIHVWEDFPTEVLANSRTITYYPFFELACSYLFSPSGAGNDLSHLTALYEDLGGGIPFATAFETHMGLNLQDFEAQYFDLMKAYLGQ